MKTALRTPAAVALTILVAALSFHLFEEPLRTGRLSRLGARRIIPATAMTLAASVAVTSFLGGTAVARLNPWGPAARHLRLGGAPIVMEDMAGRKLYRCPRCQR